MVASLIPRNFEYQPENPIADLTDQELKQRMREVEAQLAQYFEDLAGGAQDPYRGADPTCSPQREDRHDK
jgi:hypothetical protein